MESNIGDCEKIIYMEGANQSLEKIIGELSKCKA